MSLERVMALDVGDARVGVALSDPSLTYGLPYGTLAKREPQLFAELADIVRTEHVSLIVLGMPYELSGSVGEQAKKVEQFRDRLLAYFQSLPALNCVQFDTWDERFSSFQAERAIAGSSLRNARRSAAVDKIAASFILESYLMRRRAGGRFRQATAG